MKIISDKITRKELKQMTILHHKGLTTKQWFSKNIFEQMANIGSEAERTIKWCGKDQRYSELAFERCL